MIRDERVRDSWDVRCSVYRHLLFMNVVVDSSRHFHSSRRELQCRLRDIQRRGIRWIVCQGAVEKQTNKQTNKQTRTFIGKNGSSYVTDVSLYQSARIHGRLEAQAVYNTGHLCTNPTTCRDIFRLRAPSVTTIDPCCCTPHLLNTLVRKLLFLC